MDADQRSEYNQNDGWVVVNTKVPTKVYTRSRSPQYNGDNEPSGHKANASTSPSRNDSFTFEEVKSFEAYYYPHPPRQQTISNGSFETATSTTADLAGIYNTTTNAQYTSNGRASAATRALTKSSLQRHQEEQERLAAVNVPHWIAHSTPGYRYVQYQPSASTHDSMADGRSMPSTAGSAPHGGNTRFQPSSVGNEDIVAAGAWSDDPINALINSSSHLGGLTPSNLG